MAVVVHVSHAVHGRTVRAQVYRSRKSPWWWKCHLASTLVLEHGTRRRTTLGTSLGTAGVTARGSRKHSAERQQCYANFENKHFLAVSILLSLATRLSYILSNRLNITCGYVLRYLIYGCMTQIVSLTSL